MAHSGMAIGFILIVIVAGAFIFFGSSLIPQLESFLGQVIGQISAPSIDGSWTLAVNLNDAYDVQSAKWVVNQYACKEVSLADPSAQYNDAGENLLILGGSTYLSQNAPWVGLGWSLSVVTEPTTFPKVSWDKPNGVWTLTTPKATYYPTTTNDLGTFARGYDIMLHRWVIVVIGFSPYATAYAATLVCTQWSALTSYGYVVFQCTVKPTTAPSQWSMTDFNGKPVDNGA